MPLTKEAQMYYDKHGTLEGLVPSTPKPDIVVPSQKPQPKQKRDIPIIEFEIKEIETQALRLDSCKPGEIVLLENGEIALVVEQANYCAMNNLVVFRDKFCKGPRLLFSDKRTCMDTDGFQIMEVIGKLRMKES